MIAARFVNRCISFSLKSPHLTKRVAAMFGVCLMVVGLPAAAHAQSEAVEYYGLDALGSVRVVFDANGNLLGRMDYGPFGNELAPTTGKQAQIYAGLFADGEIELDHAEARVYQVRVGRLTSVDVADSGLFEPQRWNRYAYALNNPISFADPSGRQTESEPTCQQKTLVHGDDGVWRQTSNCPGGGGGGGGSNGQPSAGMMEMFNWMAMKLLDVASFNTAIVYAPEVEPQASGSAYHPSRAVELAVDATVVAVAVATGTAGAVSRGLAAEEAAAATVSEGTTIYRVFGDSATPFGRYWTTQNPLTVGNYRAAAGLPTSNSGRFVVEAQLLRSAGTELRVAAAGPLTTRLTTPVTELFFSAPPVPGINIIIRRVSGVNPPF